MASCRSEISHRYTHPLIYQGRKVILIFFLLKRLPESCSARLSRWKFLRNHRLGGGVHPTKTPSRQHRFVSGNVFLGKGAEEQVANFAKGFPPCSPVPGPPGQGQGAKLQAGSQAGRQAGYWKVSRLGNWAKGAAHRHVMSLTDLLKKAWLASAASPRTQEGRHPPPVFPPA